MAVTRRRMGPGKGAMSVNIATVVDPAELLDHYSRIYLQQYWPSQPASAAGWADNAVLMLAYQDAALAVYRHFHERPVKMLDISTGPALGPLLAMLTCVSEVQLSDYNADNRRALEVMPIEHWRAYVPMLVRLYERPEQHEDEILGRLDHLRRMHRPVAVDLFRDPPFGPEIRPESFELISMQFVADGITTTESEYLRCLGRATDLVRAGGAFIMSAVVDSRDWELGGSQQPSPEVSEALIRDFLASQGFAILNLSRSMRLDGLTYSGGWIVLSAARHPSGRP